MGRTIHFVPARWVAAFLANIVIDGPRLDPVRWAPLIAPRPFIMVNAASDERLPRESIEALYRSAHEPKELHWMPGAHIHGDAPTIQRLVAIVMSRVAPQMAVRETRPRDGGHSRDREARTRERSRPG